MNPNIPTEAAEKFAGLIASLVQVLVTPPAVPSEPEPEPAYEACEDAPVSAEQKAGFFGDNEATSLTRRDLAYLITTVRRVNTTYASDRGARVLNKLCDSLASNNQRAADAGIAPVVPS
jgi:hypothetical protein